MVFVKHQEGDKILKYFPPKIMKYFYKNQVSNQES